MKPGPESSSYAGTAGDPHRPMPAAAGARLDGVHSALATLANEERRLEQLGFEWPLARVRQQRRYWQFLEALFSLEPMASRPRGNGDRPWRVAPR